jgi:hypothetical protein
MLNSRNTPSPFSSRAGTQNLSILNALSSLFSAWRIPTALSGFLHLRRAGVFGVEGTKKCQMAGRSIVKHGNEGKGKACRRGCGKLYVLCPFRLQYMLTEKFPACKGLAIKWFHRIILYKILEKLGERTLKHKSAKGVNRVGSCAKPQGWVRTSPTATFEASVVQGKHH